MSKRAEFFPNQKPGGSVGCLPIGGSIALLTLLIVVFMMAQGTGFFEALWKILVFVYEILDELWSEDQ